MLGGSCRASAIPQQGKMWPEHRPQGLGGGEGAPGACEEGDEESMGFARRGIKEPMGSVRRGPVFAISPTTNRVYL